MPSTSTSRKMKSGSGDSVTGAGEYMSSLPHSLDRYLHDVIRHGIEKYMTENFATSASRIEKYMSDNNILENDPMMFMRRKHRGFPPGKHATKRERGLTPAAMQSSSDSSSRSGRPVSSETSGSAGGHQGREGYPGGKYRKETQEDADVDDDEEDELVDPDWKRAVSY